MDLDSSNKFISSLAKFLQSLCNGYVEFDNGVEVIGHIYINVDTGKKIDYILNEKVCKTDQNSVTFISNSFHAQPAEKNITPKSVKSSDIDKPSDPGSLQTESDEVMILDDGETKTLTVESDSNSRISNLASPLSSKSTHSLNSKRSYNQSFNKSQVHKQSVKLSRTDNSSQNLDGGGNLDSDSIPSERSNSSNLLSSQVQEQFRSNAEHLSTSVFLPPYGQPSSSGNSGADLKQEPETDLSLLQVKEEYDPGLEEAQEAYEESQSHGAYGATYDGTYYSGGHRGAAQMSDFSPSQDELFQGSGDIGDASGDRKFLYMKGKVETIEQAAKRRASQRDRTRRYRERLKQKLTLFQMGINAEDLDIVQSAEYNAMMNQWPQLQSSVHGKGFTRKKDV